MTSSTHAFICSKPFQLVSILNLPYNFQDECTRRILIILDHFPEAKKVAENIQQVYPFWHQLYFIQSRSEVATILRNTKAEILFTENDTGKLAFVWSLLVKEMNVYEEGTQNYRTTKPVNSKRPLLTNFKYFLTSFFGWGEYHGSHTNTKSIFLYNPDYFKKELVSLQPKVKQMRQPLYTFLLQNLQLLNRLFPIPEAVAAIKNEHVAVYVTAHFINEKVLQVLHETADRYDRVLIKVHAQLVMKSAELLQRLRQLSFQVITESFLAEILFMTLIKNGNKLTVFHDSSTACLYLRENDNLNIHDYREGNYRHFYKKLRDCYLNAPYSLA